MRFFRVPPPPSSPRPPLSLLELELLEPPPRLEAEAVPLLLPEPYPTIAFRAPTSLSEEPLSLLLLLLLLLLLPVLPESGMLLLLLLPLPPLLMAPLLRLLLSLELSALSLLPPFFRALLFPSEEESRGQVMVASNGKILPS